MSANDYKSEQKVIQAVIEAELKSNDSWVEEEIILPLNCFLLQS